MKKKSFLLVFSLVVLALLAVYTVFAYVKQGSLGRELTQTERLLASLKEEDLQSKNEDVVNAVKAIESVEVLEGEGLKWSRVLKDIRNTLPTDNRVPKVEVLSYSGNSGSSLALSMKTLGSSDNAYFDVAEVIKDFDDSDNFTGVFVPSISGSDNEDGEEILSFNLNLNYLEDVPGAVDEEDLLPVGR